MEACSRLRKSPNTRSDSRRCLDCAARERPADSPSRLAAMRPFAVSHSTSHGRMITGSMVCVIFAVGVVGAQLRALVRIQATLEAVLVTRRVALGGRRLVQQAARVHEMLLRRENLLEL